MKIRFGILSIQSKEANKTAKYLDKLGADYTVFIPRCFEEFSESYGDSSFIYDDERVKKLVDFMGTNIKNGASVGRTAVIEYARNLPDDEVIVLLDDDYAGVCANKPINQYKSLDLLETALTLTYQMSIETGLDLGGYSGGAIPHTKSNIMQIFFITNKTPINKFNKILNEDVVSSIYDWHRGIGTFGLATILRSGAQTAEMEKFDGNTKMIYMSDRSWRKSFGSVLADPKHSKIISNPVNDRGLWHHKIEWKKIKPMIIDKDSYGIV